MILGAGRATKESSIDLSVGLELRKKVGDYVQVGEPLVTVHSNAENIEEVRKRIYDAYTLQTKEVEAPSLILKEITN